MLIDTNLLVLLLVGTVDPTQIERFKRTRAYTRVDFDLLRAFVNGFDALVTTPNILTEASNLTGQLGEPLRGKAFAALASIAHGAEERYYPSRSLVGEPMFLRLGLTDTAVAVASREDVSVLTDDLDLYGRLANSGATVYNFNHIRFISDDGD